MEFRCYTADATDEQPGKVRRSHVRAFDRKKVIMPQIYAEATGTIVTCALLAPLKSYRFLQNDACALRDPSNKKLCIPQLEDG
jgi:hypothetical protein